MSYRQISDILKTVNQFHDRLMREIQRHSQCSDDPRLDLLADYLKHQRGVLQEAVKRDQEDESQNVLDTWIQFTPDDELKESIKKLQLKEGEPVAELFTRVLEADQALLDLYEILSEQTSAERVREFFNSLRGASLSFAEQRSWGLREPTN
jgi:hypothetical protein